MLYSVIVSIKSNVALGVMEKGIGEFSLRSQSQEMTLDNIQAWVRADTADNALTTAQKIIGEFCDKLALIMNTPITIIPHSGSVSADEPGGESRLYLTTTGRPRHLKSFSSYEQQLVISKKHPRKRPLKFYHDGLQAQTTFGQFSNYYRVLEFYLRRYKDIDNWIKSVRPRVPMRRIHDPDRRRPRGSKTSITIFTSIRHRLAHGKTGGYAEQRPLSESSVRDVRYVERYVADIKFLAHDLIKERGDL